MARCAKKADAKRVDRAIGIGWLLIRRPKHGWLLLLWGVPLLVAYLAYYCGLAIDGGLDGLNQILYVRFFLTLCPAFILGALALAYALPRLRGITTAIVTCAMLLLPLLHLRDAAVFQWPKNGWASHGREIAARAQALPMYRWLQVLQRDSQQAAAVGAMVRQHVPDGAVLVADHWFAYFMDYVGDYHLYYPSYFPDGNYWDFGWLARQLASLHKPKPYPLQRRRVEELQAALGERSEKERLAILAERLRRHLAQGRRVFLVTERPKDSQWSSRFGDAFRITPVAGLPNTARCLFSIGPAATVARVNNPREVVATGPNGDAPGADLAGDGRVMLADLRGNLLDGQAVPEAVFDLQPICVREVLVLGHDGSFRLCPASLRGSPNGTPGRRKLAD